MSLLNYTPWLFSFFSAPVTRVVPTLSVTPFTVYRYLVSDIAAAATASIRSASTPEERRELKRKRLDFVVPGAVLSRRCLDGLLRASGLMVLDFDHLGPFPAGLDAGLSVLSLVAPLWDKFNSVLGFVSPSGDGYKLIIDIDAALRDKGGISPRCPLTTAQERQAAAAAYKSIYEDCGEVCARMGFELDKSGSDITRACYLPHDPLPRIAYEWMPRIC